MLYCYFRKDDVGDTAVKLVTFYTFTSLWEGKQVVEKVYIHRFNAPRHHNHQL